MGRRRPWIIGAQFMMAVTLLGILWSGNLSEPAGSTGQAAFSPEFIWWLGVMFFVHNCFASLQDVATDALAVDVLPIAVLELPVQQVDLAPGGKATIPLRVRRNVMLTEPIELSVSALPRGVTLAAHTVPLDADAFDLVLEAAPTATSSPIRRIVQVKPQVKLGDRTVELPSLRFALRVSKP